MKLFVNGSLFGNLLLLGVGAVCGAAGYWTAEQWGMVPASAGREEKVDSAFASSASSQRAFSTRSIRGSAGSAAVGEAGSPEPLREENFSSEPMARSEALRRAGAEGARRDLQQALVFGHSLSRLQDKLDYFRGLFGVWSDVDAEAALAYAKGHFSTGLLQSEVIGLVVNKWGASHPQEARLWTEQNLSGTTKERALTDLMIGWTRRSPDSAAAWLEHSQNGSASIVSAVGRTWAEQDPKSAAIWLGGMPSGVAKRTATLAVANEWTRQDPEKAAEFFKDELDGEDGLDLATIIADVWGTSDPESAALWVSDLPAGAIRDQAAGALATVWGTRDVEAAARWSDAIEDAGMRSQVVAHLGTTWGALQPARALEWLSTLPTDLAEVGMVGALNSWSVVDPQGMRDWVEHSEQNATSDAARRSLADVLSQNSILDSIDVAMGIGAPDERNDAVARYFRQWRKTDDASAQEWLGMAWEVMPEGLKERLNREQKAHLTTRK